MKAIKTRKDMMITGTNRRTVGGGGNGGKSGGMTRRDAVKTTIIKADLEK